RQQHDHHHNHRSGQRRPVATGKRRDQPPRPGGAGGGCLRHGHRVLTTRGSIAACTRSTTRFRSTYDSETSNVTPRIAGVSSDPIAAAEYAPSPGQLKIASTRNVFASEYANTSAASATTGFSAGRMASRV